MAFTAPTAAEFKSRFPAFVNLAAATIDIALGSSEAALMVDDSWNSQDDFTKGRMLYAAHVLTLDGYGSGAEAQAASAGTLGFRTMKSGQLTLERFSSPSRGSSGGKMDPLEMTTYGVRFKALLYANRPHALVARSS